MESIHVYLPHHIIFDNILARLPAKILQQLKSVSKLWHESISDPCFIKRHLDRRRSQPPGRVNGKYIRTESHTYSSTEEGDFELNLKDILPESIICVYTQSSCDGLLVVSALEHDKDPDVHNFSSVYICNPITRQCISLPKPGTVVRDCLLVFDDTIGRYKIFCASDEWSLLVLTLGGCDESWRETKLTDIAALQVLLFNRKVYWWSVSDFHDNPVILSLDVASEEIREIQVPAQTDLQYMLMEVKGSLYLIHRRFNEHCYTTWIFNDEKEPSWTEVRKKKYEPFHCPNEESGGFDCDCHPSGGTIIYGGEDSDLDEMENQFKLARLRSKVEYDKIYHYSSLVDINIIQSGAQKISGQPKIWPPNFKAKWGGAT